MNKKSISNKQSAINNLAFTLLEILVVIGIIVTLVGLVSTSYSTAQKKARDSRRKSDLKQIQDAFEQYYSVCNYTYPGALGDSVECADPVTVLMPTVPVDPKTEDEYTYTNDAVNNTYTICTDELETETPATYCLSNQQ